MAIINVDDAHILNETGAQVDKVTGLFTKDESTTSGEKSQARYNIGAGGSNRNLLDNAYFVGGGSQLGDGIFPINQRGQTQYTGGGVQLDRWRAWAGDDTIVLTANGVQYTSPTNNGIFQYFPHFPCGDDTCTFSAKIGGTIYSVTLPEGQNDATFWGVGFALIANRSNNTVGIISANTTILLQAVKLEKGSISTLANDAPPNFGEELWKCQRYLWVQDFPLNNVIAHGVSLDATGVAFDIVTPAQMRSTPTVSYSGGFVFVGNGGYTTMTGLIGVSAPHANHITLSCAGTVSAYTEYSLVPSPSTGRLVFSAEL